MAKWYARLFALVAFVGLGLSCAVVQADTPRFKIGFSQATTTEPWRLLFNTELRTEAAKYPEIELLVRNAQDSVSKQVSDVHALLDIGIDALLISPKVAEGLTEVVNKAYESGVPVFVLDRDISNDRYTQFIGSDNRAIGEAAGRYVVDLLGGAGKAKGTVVEIWGGMASTPAQDRHRGFRAVTDGEPGIRFLIPPTDGDWKMDQGYRIMREAMAMAEAQGEVIDVVYAHNDPMAYGAYLAAEDTGKGDQIAFVGIDAIPSEGVRWVAEGILDATFLYATPGAEAIRQALAHLNGQTVPKRVTLPTATVTLDTAQEIMTTSGLPPATEASNR
ncbi:MAG: substrate-binding domain-containing protein [Magnetovibrionaceae bacterium]